MRVGFATVDFSRTYKNADGVHPLGGAGHYRVGIVADALARHGGHEVTVGTLCSRYSDGEFGILPLANMYDADEQRRAATWWNLDVVVLQRWMHQMVLDDLPRARGLGQVIVNDIDDHFDRLPPSNIAYWQSDAKRNPTENRRIYRKILGCSSLITCSTPTLADYYRTQLGVETVVLRNAIDLDRWQPHAHQDPPALGWVGATLFRARDLEQLRGVVKPLLGNGYAPRFHHSGHLPQKEGGDVKVPTAASKLGLSPADTTMDRMVPIDEYPNLFERIDVGVVPLEIIDFNDAKSCIKGMEYAAAGVPFVASPSPEYRWLHETHGIGRVAAKPRQWLGHLKALRDPADRYYEAMAQRLAVEAFDIERRWPEWEQVYRSLLPVGVR